MKIKFDKYGLPEISDIEESFPMPKVKKPKDIYICLYICGDILNPCVKIVANSIDDARSEFVNYLKELNIQEINKSNLYLINYSYLKQI
jgi:hypothetical protein